MRLQLTIFLTLAISAARIGMGYFNSISGPTLLYLADNVDSSVSTVSFMFMGRSIGVILGSVFAGLFKRRFPKISQLLVLGFSIAFLGIVTFLFPWIKSMWILLLNITVGGIMYGYLDAGLQALILQLWGEVGSRAHIQLFHFTYSIGAFIAPLIGNVSNKVLYCRIYYLVVGTLFCSHFCGLREVDPSFLLQTDHNDVSAFILTPQTQQPLPAALFKERFRLRNRNRYMFVDYLRTTPALHLTVSIPVQPFLVMAESNRQSTSRCAHGSEPELTFNFTTMAPILNTSAKDDSGFNPVGWGYNILGIWMFLVSLCTVILACYNIEGKLHSHHSSDVSYKTEVREEEPIRDVICIFLLVIGYYYCSVATENVFYNYLYAVTLCSDLKFTVTQASFANSLVWAGLGIGRLTGVFASNYVTPQRIIIISIITSIIDAFLMVLFGEHHAWMTWIVAFSHGFTPSVMFPSGVSWLSQITNVSGTYMFIFSIGASLGGITMLPLAGYLFDINPFSVMLQVLILAIVNAFFFGFAVYVGNKHLRFLEKKNVRKSSDSPDETDKIL